MYVSLYLFVSLCVCISIDLCIYLSIYLLIYQTVCSGSPQSTPILYSWCVDVCYLSVLVSCGGSRTIRVGGLRKELQIHDRSERLPKAGSNHCINSMRFGSHQKQSTKRRRFYSLNQDWLLTLFSKQAQIQGSSKCLQRTGFVICNQNLLPGGLKGGPPWARWSLMGASRGLPWYATRRSFINIYNK